MAIVHRVRPAGDRELIADLRGVGGAGHPRRVTDIPSVDTSLPGRFAIGAHLDDEGGLRLAIDDFGAGWSSLSRLRLLPVHTLKIDRSFLREIPDDPEAGAIVDAVIALADALGMDTVAEGVETRVQALFLAAQGCRFAQGRWFGDPVPAAELTDALRDASRH